MPKVVGGSVVWDLEVDSKKFSQGLANARSEIGGFEKSLKSAEGGSKAFLGVVGTVAAAGTAFATFGVKTAGNLESARQGFVALLGSAEAADSTMARIKKEAAATPFELPGLVEGTQALTAITKDGNKAIDVLLDVGKAVAISGKGQAELDRVVFNLQQISATGQVTAMDIRQFQSAIPIFNDILAASDLTVESLQNADNASELLFDAFKKAGAEGGIAAQGFAAQAGTFNQLWSNLMDTVTIGASEFVKNSGIFDMTKQALSGLIDTINKFTTPEAIKGFMDFIIQNGPIIIGIILGGITPALYAMASGFIAAMAPLIPFIAAGAAIGVMVKLLIDAFGGWDNVMKAIQPTLDLIGKVFKEVILPPLQDLWKQITEELLPALQDLWRVVQPVIIPVLKVLGAIIGTVVVVAIKLLIEILKVVVGVITMWVEVTKTSIESVIGFFKGLASFITTTIPNTINNIVTWFKNLPNSIKSAISGLANILTQPFKDAWSAISKLVDKIKNGLDKINPFHRESPSLVDNVIAGVSKIQKEYGSLGRMSIPSPAFEPSVASSIAMDDFGGDSKTVNQSIKIDVGRVNDMQDIEAIGRELGFRAGLLIGV